MSDTATAKPTKRLLIGAGACLLGFPVFAVLHNLLDVLGEMTSDVVILSRILGFLGAASFVIALIVCPAGFAICLVAAVLDRLTVRWKTTSRWIAIILVSAIAGVGAIQLLNKALSMIPSPRMTIVRDKAAGLNGSFEVVKSGLPVNWFVYDPPQDEGRAEFSVDTSESSDGDRSVRFEVQSIDSSRHRWRNPGLFRKLDADEGQIYNVTFWLKNQGCSIWVRINSEEPVTSSSENAESAEVLEYIGPDRTGEGEWRQFTYTYTVPPQYSDIRFEVNVVAPGTLWIDDVRIEPAR